MVQGHKVLSFDCKLIVDLGWFVEATLLNVYVHVSSCKYKTTNVCVSSLSPCKGQDTARISWTCRSAFS